LLSEFFSRKERKGNKDALVLLPAFLPADLINFVFN
jgi:hypothetical protein